MSAHFHSYINSAVAILKAYSGTEPFHLYIKKYFAANKKYGSKDRKQIATLCYNYFRLGHAAKNISTEERIQLAEKIANGELTIGNDQLVKEIFSFADELSEGIEVEKFNRSFLIQPELFLRIRPGNLNRVTGKLAGAALSYKSISENCIALPNSTKIDAVIHLDKEAVIQDYNSQRVGEFFQLPIANCQLPISVWDCCAASGGKSIMAHDLIKNIELTASDKRESILQNLHKRFAKAGINNYHSFVADLENSKFKIQNSKFDLIICDAPCTGSGTWSRTPEQLFYFKKESIDRYADLQKKIIENVIAYLKQGGHFLYVTCSVFKKENEAVAEFIQQKFHLKLQKMEVLKGYEIKADTMFAALLQK